MELKLSENIRTLRKERGMTQEQLANALGVTVGAVYKWEAGLSIPEVRLLMEMADLFDSSVDSLLGYEQQSGNVNGRIKRIRDLMTQKKFDEAVAESEKALQKYPNNFRLVYTSAFMYMVKTAEDKSRTSMLKSNELFEKAITLLDPNTAGEINEVTINNYIATNFMSVGDMETALEILKKNNVHNINSSMISFLYAVELGKAGDALVYVKRSFIDFIISTTRTTYAASFAYAKKHDEACITSLAWLIGFLDSLKASEAAGALAYTDKLKAISLALMSVWEETLGYSEQACKHINEAYDLASAFDAAPVNSAHGLLFVGDVEGTLVDSFGDTVCEAVESYVFGKVPANKISRKMRALWDARKE